MELPCSKEELQRARYLLHDSFFERLQNLAVVVIWKTTLLLSQPCFFNRQPVATLNFFSQLTPTKKLFSGIDGTTIMQHAQCRHGGADIHNGNRQFVLARSKQRSEKPVGTFQSIGFNIHHLGRQPSQRERGLANLDILLTASCKKHLHATWRARSRPLHFEIDRHLFEWIRNVLI